MEELREVARTQQLLESIRINHAVFVRWYLEQGRATATFWRVVSSCRPLHLAVERGNWRTARVLLEGGADPCVLDGNGRRAWECTSPCAERNALELCQRDFASGLKQLSVLVDFSELKSAIDCGAWHELSDVANRCDLSDPLLQHAQHGSILHYAAAHARARAIEVLVAHGAPVDVPNTHGQTPLHVAAQLRRMHCLVALIRCGANLKATDADSNAPVDLLPPYWSAVPAALRLCESDRDRGMQALLRAIPPVERD